MAAAVSVDVCVATFRRPALLAVLLDSLAAQDLPEGLAVRVIVVDNDAAGSAVDAVSAFAETAARVGMSVTYVVEPTQGISYARNRALELASADWLAFVDDDERVDRTWLASHLDTARRHGAAVVFGPVLAVLAADCPAWIRRGRFFDRPRHATGTLLPFGATNNALVDGSLVRRLGHRFSPDYAHTGGEDTDFFARLGAAGARMVWCDEATVSEDVPPARANLRWLLRRHFRSGQTFARIFVPRLGWGRRLAWAAKRGGFVLVAACATPPLMLLRRDWGIRALLAMVRNGGQLTGLSRFRYLEYR